MDPIDSTSTMHKLYTEVIEDVIKSVKDTFIDEGVDEEILEELKQIWQLKLTASKAVEVASELEQQLNDVLECETKEKEDLTPIQITLPGKSNQPPRALTLDIPSSVLKNQILREALTASVITEAIGISNNEEACKFIQNHILTVKKEKSMKQVDGANGSSDDDSTIEYSEEEIDEAQTEIHGNYIEEDSLNSEDDISNDDATELFDSENIIVCQYDRIIRNRNKWKFHLKDGIMHLAGKDYVFQKASGYAEW